MARSSYDPDDIYDAASFACVRVLPRTQRTAYVRDIRVKYRAEIVVYILQALSHGLTDIFIGLLTSFLYDKAKSKVRSRRSLALKRAIRQQRRELEQLRQWLEGPEGGHSTKGIRRRYETYDQILTKIEKSDPSIAEAVEDAIMQLEKRGAAALREKVNASFHGKSAR